jgi:predicted RNA-binding protein
MRLEAAAQRNLFDQVYPIQVEVEIKRGLAEPIPFQPLVSRLSFIRKSTHWGAYLQGHPMRELNYSDFSFLHSTIMDAEQVVNEA